MAIRNIRCDKDEILRKKSKDVEEIDNKIRELVMDMLDTMYKNDGVGLAAPQVGILKRVLVYDVGEGPHVMINPVKVKEVGCQSNEEGCLSSPNIFGIVDRPEVVHVMHYDVEGNKTKTKAKDIESVVICHEMDHLDGVLFLDKAYDVYTASPEEIEAARKINEKEADKKNKNKNGNNRNNKHSKRKK